MTIEYLSPGKKRVLPEDLEKLEFDEWRVLFDRDPEQFDRYRKQLLDQQIALAPEESRPRLHGLLFQMEAEAVRSRSPIAYSMRLSAMMMDTFDQLRQQLELLTGTQQNIDTELQSARKSADIIPFDHYRLQEK